METRSQRERNAQGHAPAIEWFPIEEQGSSQAGWCCTPPPRPGRHSGLSQLRGQGSVTGLKWAEPKSAATCPVVHRTAPPERLIQPEMSTVPRLRSPVKQVKFEEGELWKRISTFLSPLLFISFFEIFTKKIRTTSWGRCRSEFRKIQPKSQIQSTANFYTDHQLKRVLTCWNACIVTGCISTCTTALVCLLVHIA